MAAKEACKFLTEQMAIKVSDLGKDALISAAKTSMSSKIIGPECDLFGKIVVDAVLECETISALGDKKYPIKNINILKSHGQSSIQSTVFSGYAL